MGKEGEGPNQWTGISDPWEWTTGWGLIVGMGGGQGQGRGEQWGKIRTTVIEQKF